MDLAHHHNLAGSFKGSDGVRIYRVKCPDRQTCPEKHPTEEYRSRKRRQIRTTFENRERGKKRQESEEDGDGNKLNEVADDKPAENTDGRWDEELRQGNAGRGRMGGHIRNTVRILVSMSFLTARDR